MLAAATRAQGVAEGGLSGTDFHGVIDNLNGTVFSGLGSRHSPD